MALLESGEVTRLRGGELAHGVEHREPRLRVVAGVDDHTVFVVTTADTDEEGMWELTAGAVDALRQALETDGRQRPTTLAELLDTANR